jgi:hypothetical protein
MAMNMGIGIAEHDRQNALLASAAARIDPATNIREAREQVVDLLDWLAYFTREHFGFQQRLLNECSQHREYLLNRMAIHNEFRRRLAQLCLDTMRGDATVPARMRALCEELQDDARAHDDVFASILRNDGASPKLRRKPRRGPISVEATP